MPTASRRWPLIVAIGIPFVLYLATLFPGVGDRSGSGDAIELQYVGRILGVAHEPGYPQFVLLSHFWTYLPVPSSLAVKINLLSAVLTALAGLFFYLTLRRLGARTWATVLVTLTLLSSLDIWLLATQAEVYSLNLLWVSLVLWSAVRWYQTGRHLDLVLLFFAYALSFGNHLTMILLLPGLALLVLWREPGVILRWQTWIWAAVAITFGILQYALLLWRSYNPHPALPPWFPLEASLPDLWSYVSGDRFVDKHWLKTGALGWLTSLGRTLVHGLLQLSPILILFSAVGMRVGLRRDVRLILALTLMSISVIGFAAAYGIKDSLFYAIPAWLVLALFGGIGLDWILGRWPRWNRAVVVAAVVLLALRLVSGLVALRVDEVQADLRASIDTAEPGSGILVGRRDRQARLADGYYRYGLQLPRVAGLSFHSTSRIFRNGVEEFGDQPLYFQSSQVRSELEYRWVDYRSPAAGLSPPEVWVTGTDQPIQSLHLRSLWNQGLALAIRDRSQDLLGDRSLHLHLVSGSQRRSKGHTAIDLDASGAWDRSLEHALAAAQPGDWLLLVVPAAVDTAHVRIVRILRRHGVELGDQPFSLHAIAFWQSGNAAATAVIVTDLEGQLDLELKPR